MDLPTTLVDRIERFLDALLTIQQQLQELLKLRRKALAALKTEEVLRLSRHEHTLSEALRTLWNTRGAILRQAIAAGQPADSLVELLQSSNDRRAATLLAEVERSRQLTALIRHETWVQWIIAQRCFSHYSGVLELIANGGKASPGYDEHPSLASGKGGSVLDAAA